MISLTTGRCNKSSFSSMNNHRGSIHRTMLTWYILFCTSTSLFPYQHGVVQAESSSPAKDFFEDVVDWFEDLVTKAPKVIADCIINDVEQTIDTVKSFFVPECGLEAFEARIPNDILLSTSGNHKVVGDDRSADNTFGDGSKLFVYDTSDMTELRNYMECVDPNLEDIIFTADTLLTVKKGLKVSNVAAYLAVCFLQEIVEDSGCFDRDTTKACLVHDKNSNPIEAYHQCFHDNHHHHHQEEEEDERSYVGTRIVTAPNNISSSTSSSTTMKRNQVAQLVNMAELKAGDVVLTSSISEDGSSSSSNNNMAMDKHHLFYDSVMVNMYRHSPETVARRIRIQYGTNNKSANGDAEEDFGSNSSSIVITPNHLVWADNEWKLAHQVHAGSTLSNGLVVKRVIREGTGPIINPVTFHGSILAFSCSSTGGDTCQSNNTTKNIPLLSHTMGSSFSNLFLSISANGNGSSYPWWLVSLALARAFPSSVQDYYETFDKVLEFVLDRTVPYFFPSNMKLRTTNKSPDSGHNKDRCYDGESDNPTLLVDRILLLPTTIFQFVMVMILDLWLSSSFILFCLFSSKFMTILLGSSVVMIIMNVIMPLHMSYKLKWK